MPILNEINWLDWAPFLAFILTAITIYMITSPLMQYDSMRKRMKNVATERTKLRETRRDILVKKNQNASMSTLNNKLALFAQKNDLEKITNTKDLKHKMVMAGIRNEAFHHLFLISKIVLPIVLTILAYLYFHYVEDDSKWGIEQYISLVILCSAIGWFVPDLILNGRIAERMKSIDRTFPEAMDLLLICVGSGMSAEAAFKKVGEEIGLQSPALAEELGLLNAELSYLDDRKIAYDNLAKRTNLESVKSVVTALIQAEKYGTSLGQTLKILAQENRDMRMNKAEKKAASLPPKLTVPMIIFTLPVLFLIIMTPAIIQVLEINK